MFIKIFDEQTALNFKECGFSYVTETINKQLKVYCFEATPEFSKFFEEHFCSKIKFVRDNVLNF